jgi:pimeloyl-ACP methyl ester carboxylesterase
MSAKLDSFTEGVFDLHCDVDHGDDGIVTIDIPVVSASFSGTLSGDGKVLSGKWNQAGKDYDLVLTQVPLEKTREPKPRKRPQTPKGPFPYRRITVKLENTDAKITLAGTLTLPKTDKPPVAVLINGSGPQDRDETIAGHKPFAVIADHFSRNGIAVLRYDERGVGRSTGQFAGSTSEDLATDVEAAMEYLKTRDDVDPEKIILVGHSEGGLLAPMIASRRTDVAGLVLLAAPGINGEKIVFDQSRRIAQASGLYDEAELEKQEGMLKIAFGLLKAPVGEAGDFYDRFKSEAATLVGESPEDFELAPALEVSVKSLDSPWFRFFASYEPVPALEKVKCPTLVLFGQKDLQVFPEVNLPPIKEALNKANNEDVTFKVVPNLNHLFQNCKTGSPDEYGAIEETFSPAVLELMSKWANERF